MNECERIVCFSAAFFFGVDRMVIKIVGNERAISARFIESDVNIWHFQLYL